MRGKERKPGSAAGSTMPIAGPRDGRRERVAAALRANLHRRKAQIRERALVASEAEIADILDFWFDNPPTDAMREIWFKNDPAFDAEIRRRFQGDVDAAREGTRDDWARTARGALALLLLLDQFARNLYRGEALAFAGDARAHRVAEGAIAAGFDLAHAPIARVFFYLPFEHSEDLSDQDRALALFERLPPAPWRDRTLEFARRHRDIVRRFGRFPHRNPALGRTSTPEEIEFLKEPGSSF